MRWFVLLFWFVCCSSVTGKAVTISSADSAELRAFWCYAQENKLLELSVDKRIPVIGRFFLGKPYKAGTLNVTTKEMPVINLRELDCVTLVENTLALAFLDRYDENALGKFVDNLTKIRYRDGEIIDYTSRLHYSGDWLYEMQKHHYLKDVTQACGGVKHPLHVNFMTKNYRKYPVLLRDKSLVMKMEQIETVINKRTYYYIPKADIRRKESKIQSGDIILITTAIRGLDTSHVGIAVKKGLKTFLLHASSSAGQVVLSEVPLADYMNDISSQTGIMIGRVAGIPGMNWLALP